MPVDKISKSLRITNGVAQGVRFLSSLYPFGGGLKVDVLESVGV
jgi:hypothetical protein